MNKSTTENFQQEQMLTEEQKPMVNTSSPDIGNTNVSGSDVVPKDVFDEVCKTRDKLKEKVKEYYDHISSLEQQRIEMIRLAPPNAYTLLPAVLLNDEGYPTEEWLQYIKSYKPDESLSLLTFVEMVLIDGWYMSDCGFKLHKKYKGKRKLELHTGGWSGNEETIAAIKSNMWLTHFQMRYVMWRTGGHYYFELSVG